LILSDDTASRKASNWAACPVTSDSTCLLMASVTGANSTATQRSICGMTVWKIDAMGCWLNLPGPWNAAERRNPFA
jgi:4-hydroxy-3-methylbut-2-en-1-yl diphosphate synthase IspG/GcpE